MNTSTSEQDRGLPSALKFFTCPSCGSPQNLLCPGFGQHSPSPTLIRIGNYAQCTQCQSHVAQMICEYCKHITTLTADIPDDPDGNRYKKGRQDDVQQRDQSLELYRRFWQIASMEDQYKTNEATMMELRAILTDQERLLNNLPDKYPPLKPYLLRADIAQTQEQIANAYRTLDKSQESLLYYDLARQTYQALGNKAKTELCSENIAQIQLRDEGIIDAELQRRQAQLEALPNGTYPYFEAMLELGQLYRDAGDNFAAQEVFLQVERELKDLVLLVIRLLNDPLFGNEQSEASLAHIFPHLRDHSQDPSWSDIDKSVANLAMNKLQLTLYFNLGLLYEDDRSEEAMHFFQLAQQTLSSRLHQRMFQLRVDEVALRYDIKSLMSQKHNWRRKFLADNLLRRARALETKMRRQGITAGLYAVLMEQADILLAMKRNDEAIAVLSKARREFKGYLMHTTGVTIQHSHGFRPGRGCHIPTGCATRCIFG